MEQFLRCERLGQIIHRPGLDGLDGELGRGVGGEHDRRQVGPLIVEAGEKFVATHAAEAGVGDDHEKFLARQQIQRLFGGFDCAHGIVLALQHRLQGQAHVLLVVHDEHGWQQRVHWACFSNDFAGKVNVNSAPFPSSDSTRT